MHSNTIETQNSSKCKQRILRKPKEIHTQYVADSSVSGDNSVADMIISINKPHSTKSVTSPAKKPIIFDPSERYKNFNTNQLKKKMRYVDPNCLKNLLLQSQNPRAYKDLVKETYSVKN